MLRQPSGFPRQLSSSNMESARFCYTRFRCVVAKRWFSLKDESPTAQVFVSDAIDQVPRRSRIRHHTRRPGIDAAQCFAWDMRIDFLACLYWSRCRVSAVKFIWSVFVCGIKRTQTCRIDLRRRTRRTFDAGVAGTLAPTQRASGLFWRGQAGCSVSRYRGAHCARGASFGKSFLCSQQCDELLQCSAIVQRTESGTRRDTPGHGRGANLFSAANGALEPQNISGCA